MTDKPSDNGRQIKLFMPTNKTFFKTMLRCQMVLWRLNKTPIWNIPLRNWLIKKLVAYIDGNPYSIDDLDTIISEEYMAADKKISNIHELMNKLPAVDQITEDDKEDIFAISEILSTLSDYERNFLNGDEMDTMAEYLRKLSELIDERKASEEKENTAEEESKTEDSGEPVVEG